VKIAYFDCFAGISGDMALGAFVDAVLPLEVLRERLADLGLDGYELRARSVVKGGIGGTKVDVLLREDSPSHRHLEDIRAIITGSRLSDAVKERSLAVFERLAEAEARVHRTSPDRVHFHELGAVDTLVDVVGFAIAVEELGIEEVHCSPLHLGRGMTRSMHGPIPVPAPATVELLRGVPVYSRGIQSELVTPTGAALVTTFASAFGPMPPLKVERVGYGAGSRDLEIPNLLRVFIGQRPGLTAGARREGHQERVVMLEVNLDDMNPEFFDHVMARLFEEGALDVFLTRVQMKKNRPGVVLSVLAPMDREGRLVEILFDETTTIGVRAYEVTKRNLPYTTLEVDTRWGTVKVKVARAPSGRYNLAPEYEDCRRAATKNRIPIGAVYDEAKRKAGEEISNGELAQQFSPRR